MPEPPAATMFSKDAAVHSWLLQLADVDVRADSDCDRRVKMKTLKRRRQEAATTTTTATDVNIEMTTPPPSTWAPGFVDDDSSASAVSAASSTKGSRRSASPVKNISGLQRLDKPVLFGGLETNAAKSQFPSDAQQLYRDIYLVTKFQQGLFPPETRSQVEAEYDGQYHPDSVYREFDEGGGSGANGGYGGNNSGERFFDYLPVAHLFTNAPEGVSTQSRIAHAEYYRICAIRDEARDCLALRRAEASWNSTVHESKVAGGGNLVWVYRCIRFKVTLSACTRSCQIL